MSDATNKRFDLEALRQRLAGKRGSQYWRSLDEIADTPEFRQWLDDEFPNRSSLRAAAMDRRAFLKFMGASMALAGLAGCRQEPARRIVPYVQAPEELVPGKPLFYATATTLSGYALGVLAESHEGRPTKIEGNPQHPASMGRTDAFAQASILQLYDPDRSQSVVNQGEASTWDEFLTAMRSGMMAQQATRGAGLRILTGTVTSPTLADQMRRLLAMFPAAKWHAWEPVNRDNVRAGTQAAFGQDANPVYLFDRAEVVLSLDADFLMTMPGHVRYARDWAAMRRVRAEKVAMNRLYVAESTPTITGTMADHRVPVRPGDVEWFARAVAQALGVNLGGAPVQPIPGLNPDWIPAMARDLRAHPGASLVVAGDEQPPAVHALAHAMNSALGSIGKTVVYTDPVEASPANQAGSIGQLAADMQAGRVEMLVIVGTDPALTAPADLGFADKLLALTQAGKTTVHVGLHDDETGSRCLWHVNQTHDLEAWSDARSHDGTATVIQPLVQPLYDGHSAHEVLQVVLGAPSDGYDVVRGYWRTQHPGTDFESWWEQRLNDGVVPGTAAPARAMTLTGNWAAALSPQLPPPGAPGLQIVFRPDPTLWDGQYANNGWMQELPKPISKLTWDNAAFVSPATAQQLDLQPGRMVELSLPGTAKVRAPIWVLPGHADGTVTVFLGSGRTLGGRLAEGSGFDAYPLRATAGLWSSAGLALTRTPDTYRLVSTQDHHGTSQPNGRGVSASDFENNREPVHEGTLDEFRRDPKGLGDKPDETPEGSLYYDYREKDWYKDYAWGMSIDNNVCIGCNACVVACQAENNIPVVGKDQVGRGREMHWLRIDRYYNGGLDNPAVAWEPVPCMQCETAPCEPVCPVGATVHSHEGLNQMVYNRCVGTRYCSNNCPYKVRRFNFYKFTAGQPDHVPGNYDIPIIQLSANPDVTVRGRGVMEKCTYCVQRINTARIQTKEEGRKIRDGEVLTACQQACPTNAIVFGDINDPRSMLSLLKRQPHNYSLLGELNTRPRTTYLAKLRNPNPEMPK